MAVSGGADSVHLLETLTAAARSTGQRLMVLHVNHAIRGPASRADGRFVAALARKLGLPYRELLADGKAVKRNGRASEGRLREVRYALLDQALGEFGGEALYTAHHQDDRVESILLAALRGAGLKGLRGMARRRRLAPGGPWLVRPYFHQRAAELRHDLRARRRPFCRDASNHDLSYRRNYVRHLFLPWLRAELGPDLDRRILRLGRLSRLLWRRARRDSAPLGRDSASDAMHAALTEAAGRELSRGLSEQMQRVLRRGGQAVASLAPGRALRIGADARLKQVRTQRQEPAAPEIDIRVVSDPTGRLHQVFSRLDGRLLRERLQRRGRIYLDADRVRLPLCVRGRRPGDRFQPLGWQEPGKLKNQLIARKLPRERRDGLVLFESRAGICAVETLPPSALAAVTPATRRLLRITITRTGD